MNGWPYNGKSVQERPANIRRFRKPSRPDRVWHIKYQELVDFYEKHVHLNVGYKSSMYQWMTTQRKKLCGKGPTFATHG